MAEAVTVLVRVDGRVQGVGYRWWAAEEARRRGLAGWVRNRGDGSVEALFSGPADAVAEMVAACHQGPPAARVLAVRETPAEAPSEKGFEQRPTV